MNFKLKRLRRARVLVTVAALSMGSLGVGAANADAGGTSIECRTQDVVDSDLPAAAGCDLEGWTIKTPAGISMVVPAPGMTVTWHGLADTAVPFSEITVINAVDGGVAVSRDGEVYAATSEEAVDALTEFESPAARQQESGVTQRAVSKCDASAPYVTTNKWASNNYAWFYNSIGQPTSVASARIHAGGISAVCGNRSNGVSTTYAGSIGVFPGINSAGGCTGFDNNNVVGWGDLTSQWLAMACSWTTALGYKYEVDIKFDNSGRSWHTGAGTACTAGQFDLYGVATHEMGHAVGLGHVADTEPQVMTPNLAPCSMVWRDLGRGDQNGLRTLYGP